MFLRDFLHSMCRCSVRHVTLEMPVLLSKQWIVAACIDLIYGELGDVSWRPRFGRDVSVQASIMHTCLSWRQFYVTFIESILRCIYQERLPWSSGHDFRLSLTPISAGDRGSIPRGRVSFLPLVGLSIWPTQTVFFHVKHILLVIPR